MEDPQGQDGSKSSSFQEQGGRIAPPCTRPHPCFLLRLRAPLYVDVGKHLGPDAKPEEREAR